GAALLRRRFLAAVCASMIALASAAGSTALAQEWIVTDDSNAAAIGDGGTMTAQGDDNIDVALTGGDDDVTLEITLDPDLVVDSTTAGNTVMNNDGVAIGANVVLGSTGLSIAGGPSVTLAGINAGNNAITGVADGTASDHAVNFGQLSQTNQRVDNAETAIGNAQSNITALQSDVSTAQSDISTLQGDVGTAQSDISTLQG